MTPRRPLRLTIQRLLYHWSREHGRKLGASSRDSEGLGSSLVNEDVSASNEGTRASTPGRRYPIQGPVLIVAAIAIGLALFLVVQDSGSGTVSGGTRLSTQAAAATTSPSGSTRVLPASKVRLGIVNASGIAGSTVIAASVLGALGYPIVATLNATVSQRGSSVACKAGLSKEARTLAQAVGPATTVRPFPNPPPAGAALLSCLVTLGH